MTARPTAASIDPKREKRARRFAKLWSGMNESVDEAMRPAKEALFRELPERVVEIGPGLGASFPYLRRGTRVLAFEPNPYFHDALRERAEAHGLALELRGEPLDPRALELGSAEAVISSLVLCSVPDPAGTLETIHDALAPGGRFVFIEHVAAPPGSLRRLYQRVVRRPWMAMGDGCDTCAVTHELIQKSRFEIERCELEPMGSWFDPTNLTFWGLARPSAAS